MIYHVFANRSNVGDWLSARGIQSLIRPLRVHECLCDEPFVAETLGILSAAGPDDLVIIGGGGLFMDYFAPLWEGLREAARRVPFCLWGVGYCDLKREPSRAPDALLREIVSAARLAVVRDQLTRDTLPGCGLAAPVPCPSIMTIDRPPRAGHGLLHVDNYTTAGEAVYEAMDAYGQRCARETGRAYRQTNNRIPPEDERALAGVLQRYAEADLVLSSALHGCVIAVAMGRPVLAVSGDYKIESFMDAAGLGEWVCDIDDVDDLPERLAALPTQPPVLDFVEQARAANRRVAEQVIALATRGH
jgi:polysaccharide pyruvyl transferase WcaK-like protein